MTPKRIYLSPPDITGAETSMVAEAIASGWAAPLGPNVDAFESEMCARVGISHALALSSGTAALHLALLVLGVGSGDEVWCSTLTFAATANAVRYVGATPVFVDSDEATWNLDPGLLVEELERAARTNNLPKAVIAVDLYGQCADLAPIEAACRKHGVFLIEDAAESLGATYRERNAGSFGELSILSFNGNKIITTSGGGMLLGARKDLLDRARFLSTQAREPVRHYEHSVVGYNYRMSNLLAAFGRVQLADLPRRVEARRAINRRYREALSSRRGWTFAPEANFGQSTFWLTCATIDSQFEDRDQVLDRLERANIEARPVWKPMHMQPAFHGCRSLRGEVAERLFTRGICLPSGSNLSASDQQRVIDMIGE